MKSFKINQDGLNLIKSSEGFSAAPYPDPGTNAEPITIGYGSTYYEDSSKIKLSDEHISLERANQLLLHSLVSFELEVNKLLTHSAITINQFSACVVFAYNVGLANFKASTLLKKININPLDPTIESEFSKWIYANKKVMKGLQTRRMNEYLLFKKK